MARWPHQGTGSGASSGLSTCSCDVFQGRATEEQEVCQSSGPTDRNLLKESIPLPHNKVPELSCPRR